MIWPRQWYIQSKVNDSATLLILLSPLIFSVNLYSLVLLQTQVLRVEQVNKPCIGLTQENSIENSVQDCLPYILELYGPC